MINWQNILSTLTDFPMGGSRFSRYYNGLIHGGVAIAALWLAGAITF